MRTDWPVVAAAWLLLLCATTLLTAGTLYGDAVALGGLRAAMAEAPAADRAVVVSVTTRPGGAAAIEAGIRGELEHILALTGGEVAQVATSASFADASVDPGEVTALLAFASYEGIDRHATLVDGRWAEAGGAPQEVTLSEAAAGAIRLEVGDRVTLVSRLRATLSVEIVVTGLWRPDLSDPYWLNPDLELGGSVERGSFTTVGPFVVPAADLLERPFGDSIEFEWRALPDPSGFRIDDLAGLRTALDRFDEGLREAIPEVQARVATGLPAILTTVDRAALVSRTGVLLLVFQFAVLAAYAIVLVAGMLADRRRAETALLRSRGASSAHLGAMAVLEAVILTGLAAAIAPALSLLVVRWLGASGPLAEAGITDALGLSRNALVVDGITAAACVVALTLPMLGGGPNLAGVRAAIARQAGRTLAQRLGLDLALVAVAAIALWQLRLYGAPLTRNARGVLGIDPLLIAAPGIGLLAGAVIATRLIPRMAEISERVLVRGRGLVAPMGGRGLARRPLRYTRSALLLMLAVALGTFGAAHVATWTRSQADQASYQAGADVRAELSQRAAPARTIGATFASIPGVGALMPVDRQTVDSGRGVRGGTLLGIDADAAAGIVNETPDADGRALPGFFELLAADRPEAVGAAIPADSRWLGVVVDAAFESTFFDEGSEPPPLDGFPGIHAAFVVEDGHGRLYRLTSNDEAMLVGPGQRLAVDLGTDAGGFTGPLRLRAVELGLQAPFRVGVTGRLDLRSVEATTTGSPDTAAWAPLALAPDDPGWAWRNLNGGNAPVPYFPPSGSPWRVVSGTEEGDLLPIFEGSGQGVRLISEPLVATTLGVVASRGYLDATGAQVGDVVEATLGGSQQSVRLLGVVDAFPTIDPAKPFLVIDGRALVIARFAVSGGIREPDEWWLRADDQAAAAEDIIAGPDPNATVTTTESRSAALLTDPLPLGVIGVLGLGSAAAMAFASIGFVVAATVSTRERQGEFALLRALGLSGRQLSVWLSLENAFLLTIGLATGLALGLLLAWLVLPFSTLTSSGTVAVPSPIVVIPWPSLLPIAAVAGGVFAVTLLVLRGQLLNVRIGDVLRGRDE
jgi:hypothetical protein